MKRVMWALAVAAMVLVGSATAVEAAAGSSRAGAGWSRGGAVHTGSVQGSHWYRGGGARWVGGGHRGGDWHGGTRVFIGGVGWWGWPGWWGPGWWGYPYYYAAPPVVVQPGPTTYIQQESAPPAYWYFCKDAGAYYPYVKECPGGWMQVVPQTSPPDR